MSRHIDHIVELNHEAVLGLVESRNRMAYGMLQQGLQVLRGITQTRQGTSVEPSMRMDRNICSVCSVQLPVSQTDMVYSPDNFFQIYENAFLVSDCAKNYMHPSAYEDHVAAVLMYNTALMCHRQGIQNGNFVMLERALFMYEMAASTLQQDTAYSGDNDIDDLFMLALINNMGHIHSHTFRHEKSRFCQKVLEDLIHDEISRAGSVDAASHCHFFLECLQFKEFGLTLAPAAWAKQILRALVWKHSIYSTQTRNKQTIVARVDGFAVNSFATTPNNS